MMRWILVPCMLGFACGDDGSNMSDVDPEDASDGFSDGEAGVEGAADAAGDADGVVDDDDGPETTPVCGNGVVETGEQCDDGNTVQADGCHNDCLIPRCGDGVADLGEGCDDGMENSNTMPDACRTNCRLAYCGDGVEDTGEACDDGNADNTDACLLGCITATCGDGYVRAEREECDDGNTVDTDDCITGCRTARCLDGFVWAGHEECEGFDARSCTTVCGSMGTEQCAACSWSGTCDPPVESCSGLDDDCDTTPDEGFACVMGSTMPCTTSCGSTGSGTCTTSCEIPVPAFCAPPAETCNGLDDDCDGAADETFDCVQGLRTSCSTTCGTTGSSICSSSCAWGACIPPTELCNLLDDDCDTIIDEAPTDCTLYTDCCNCVALALGEPEPTCGISECFVTTCTSHGITIDDVRCITGRCAAGYNCDATDVLCPTPPPGCPFGQIPSVRGTCWGPCVPARECA